MQGNHRQLDIMAYDKNTISIPPTAGPINFMSGTGRLSGRDFITFNIPRHLPMHRYDVILESNDTAGPQWRTIGKLRHKMGVPQVRFAEHARIAVVPDDPRLPRFTSELARGSEYIIPDTRGRNGTFEMTFTGVI
jgi:hypothetical protein